MYCVLSDCRPPVCPYSKQWIWSCTLDRPRPSPAALRYCTSQASAFIDPNLQQCYRYTEAAACTYPLDPDNGREPRYPPSGYTPYEYLVYEITKNQWFANRTLFANRCVHRMGDTGCRRPGPASDPLGCFKPVCLVRTLPPTPSPIPAPAACPLPRRSARGTAPGRRTPL
jgi:hypothetical protein